jgi:hypothetical protein
MSDTGVQAINAYVESTEASSEYDILSKLIKKIQDRFFLKNWDISRIASSPASPSSDHSCPASSYSTENGMETDPTTITEETEQPMSPGIQTAKTGAAQKHSRKRQNLSGDTSRRRCSVHPPPFLMQRTSEGGELGRLDGNSAIRGDSIATALAEDSESATSQNQSNNAAQTASKPSSIVPILNHVGMQYPANVGSDDQNIANALLQMSHFRTQFERHNQRGQPLLPPTRGTSLASHGTWSHLDLQADSQPYNTHQPFESTSDDAVSSQYDGLRSQNYAKSGSTFQPSGYTLDHLRVRTRHLSSPPASAIHPGAQNQTSAIRTNSSSTSQDDQPSIASAEASRQMSEMQLSPDAMTIDTAILSEYPQFLTDPMDVVNFSTYPRFTPPMSVDTIVPPTNSQFIAATSIDTATLSSYPQFFTDPMDVVRFSTYPRFTPMSIETTVPATSGQFVAQTSVDTEAFSAYPQYITDPMPL